MIALLISRSVRTPSASGPSPGAGHCSFTAGIAREMLEKEVAEALPHLFRHGNALGVRREALGLAIRGQVGSAGRAVAEMPLEIGEAFRRERHVRCSRPGGRSRPGTSWARSQATRELLAQGHAGAMHTRFHRGDRFTEHVRHLLVGQLLHVLEHEHGAVMSRESIEPRVQDVTCLSREQLALGSADQSARRYGRSPARWPSSRYVGRCSSSEVSRSSCRPRRLFRAVLVVIR